MKAIIFDMDGVIVDSEKIKFEITKEIVESFGFQWKQEDQEKGIGLNANDFWSHIIKKFNLNATRNELEEKFSNVYNKKIKEEAKFIPSSKKFLKKINERKIKTALASSSSREKIKIVLKKLKIENCFESIVAGDELIHAKPDPEIFLIAAKRIKAKPEECIVIEDSPLGIEAAKKAGMTAIAVPCKMTKNLDFSEADYKINSLKEFPMNLLEEKK